MLNAYEYLRLHDEESFDIYIAPTSNQGEQIALARFTYLLKKHNTALHKAGFFVRNEMLSVLVFYLKFRLLSFKRKHYGTILISSGARARIIYKLLKFDKAVFMDEGTQSLRYVPAVIQRNALFKKSEKPNKTLILLYRLLRLNHINKDVPFEIFTIYDELKDLSGKITVNQYTHLAELFKDCKVEEGTVLVLGANFWRYHFTPETYSQLIRMKLSELPYKKVLYKFHKHEGNVHIDVPGIEILDTKLPLEFYFIQSKHLPEYILCFNSSVGKIMSVLNADVKIVNQTLDLKVLENA